MKKNKIAALVISGVLAVGVVGGTFAWFTSSDAVDNIFQTGGVNKDEPGNGSGIEIYEKYTSAQMLPGDELDKIVQVKNTCDYNQLLRVKITPTADGQTIDANQIELNYYTENIAQIGDSNKDGKWVKDGEYYYYMGNLGASKYTSPLLKSITFKNGAKDNSYQGKKIDIKVEAESVQGKNDAFADEFKLSKDTPLYNALKTYQNSTDNGTDLADGSTVTDTAVRS